MRQRRTPYLRQKVQATKPPVPSTMPWRITGIVGNQVTVELSGPLNGVVTNGIPGIVRTDTGAAAISWAWVVPPPGTPTASFNLNFAVTIPNGTTFEVLQGDLTVRNSLGGTMAYGVQLWDPQTPPFPTLFVTGVNVLAGIATVATNSTGKYLQVLGAGSIQNVTTSEWQSLVSIGATTFEIQSGGTPNSPGDTFAMASPDPSIFNELGAFLQDFSEVSS